MVSYKCKEEIEIEMSSFKNIIWATLQHKKLQFISAVTCGKKTVFSLFMEKAGSKDATTVTLEADLNTERVKEVKHFKTSDGKNIVIFLFAPLEKFEVKRID